MFAFRNAAIFLCFLPTALHAAEHTIAPPQALSKQLLQNLEQHCFACHNELDAQAGLNLEKMVAVDSSLSSISKWIRIHDRIAKNEMPPAKRKQPTDEQRKSMLTDLANVLKTAEKPLSGTVLRRLNRLELEHTLHDLFGINTRLKELLPEDGRADGFENVGDALDISGVHLQRYMEVARLAINEAINKGPQPEPVEYDFRLDSNRNEANIGKHWHKLNDGAVVVFNNGSYPRIQPDRMTVKSGGSYRISITGTGYQSKEPITFAVFAGHPYQNSDAHLLGYFSFKPGNYQTISFDATLYPNEVIRLLPYRLQIDQSLSRLGPDKYQGKGIAIKEIKLTGPNISQWPGKGHQLLFGKLATKERLRMPRNASWNDRLEFISDQPEKDAVELFKQALPVLFRGPVSDTTIREYHDLFCSQLKKGSTFEESLKTTYIAALCSPDFLYFRENSGNLDSVALANRLAYFLWRSAPDAELMAVASKNLLQDSRQLRLQYDRMVRDPRISRLVEDFTDQWLNLREINFTNPDEKLYPEFDDYLRDSMIEETRSYVQQMIQENRPISEIIDSDWTMLNERLARHYQISGVTGHEFRKVKLDKSSHRGGIITHGSILKVTANGTSTSPVVRGAWLLDRILGEPPAPPPPGIPGVEPDIRGATTLREQLDKHRDSTTCNSCHRSIDPPGFALEQFDPIGGFRERYRILVSGKTKVDYLSLDTSRGTRRVAVGPKVNPSGITENGKSFADINEYKQLLLQDTTQIRRAFISKLVVYATGKRLQFTHRSEIARLAEPDDGLKEAIFRLITSPLFQEK
ncbi:MAG: DUF1592 domain-containing protein [Zavarzinella sp.]